MRKGPARLLARLRRELDAAKRFVLGRPALQRSVRPLYHAAWSRVATFHRSRLRDVVFIGVTGSAGKTTAKNLIAAVLGTEFRGTRNPGTANELLPVIRTILKTRRTDRFSAIEVAAFGPGMLDAVLAVVRPTIAVVTSVGGDHVSAFESLDGIAAEKRKVVAAVPPGGTAVLNADDPRVLAMASVCRGRVVTYGTTSAAWLRAVDVRGVWPERLSFTACAGGEAIAVTTQLYGVHWVPSVLAALAVAVVMGMPLSRAARAVSTVPPVAGRMSPVTLPDGVTFIRDDWKAALWTVAPALEFLGQAHAERKIAVIGTLSDYRGDAKRTYLKVARRALEVADHVVFVGDWASRALRVKPRAAHQTLRAFGGAASASAHLATLLRPGDLVLLKGNNVTDHLARLVLARTTGVACWRTRCRRKTFCGSCDLLHVPSGSPPDTTSIGVDPGRPAAGEHVDHIVIGLGNPEGRLATTRHNVGHRVVDALASRLGARWERRPTALVAPAPLGPGRTWLVKLLAPMNMAGAALGTLAREIDVDPSGIILVHDDLDRPAGTVGVRMRGSHGGHNGVRSILERFQSDEFPRVKIGIGRPAPPQRVDRYVLEPFTPDEQAVIDAAVARAVEQVTALVGRPRDAHPAAPRG